MDRVLVTYKIKSGRVEENENLVRAVYDELRRMNDPGIHYATFKKDDGLTFVHFASFESPESRQKFGKSEAFQAFQKDLKERCDDPPNPESMLEVDTYRFV